MVTRQYIALLILFIIIFFNKQLFFGEVFYCCDNIAINVPSKVFLIEELRHGRFPLWNPYILSGSPFLADINLGLLYPLNLLFLMFPPFRALTIGVIIDFIIAAIGMFVLGRSLRLSQFASTLSSIIFTFSGTLVVYINDVPLLHVAVLLPWIIWAWITYFTYPTKKFFLILVGLLSLQIIAGHPQLTYYTWLFGIAYVVFVNPLSIKQKTISLLSVGGLVFLLSSIQLIPFIELVHASTRIGMGFDYASFGSLNPFNMFRFFIQRLVGNLSQGKDWLQGGSVYGYIGVLPIILLFFVPFKNIRVRFFLATAVTSLLLALGKYTPVFFIAYKLVPGLGSFRSPGHFLFLYTFSLALLAGFGIEEALNSVRRKVFLKILLCIGIIFLVAPVWLVDWGVYPLMIIPKFRLLAPSVKGEVIFMILENLYIIGTLLLVARVVNKRAVFLFVVFLELFLFSRDGFVSVSEERLSEWLQKGNETAKLMKEAENYRIFVSPKLYQNPVKKEFGIPYAERETAWQTEIVRTNINMLYHLSTIDGYASLIYRPYKELFQKEGGDPTGIEFGDMSTIDWNTLGVRYVLARPDELVFKTNPLFVAIWHDSNKVLYESPHAQPAKSANTFYYGSIVAGEILSLTGAVVFFMLMVFWRQPILMSRREVHANLPKAKRMAR